MISTIQLNKETKEKLDALKIHSRETYNELLLRLLEDNFSTNVSRESLIETLEVFSDPDLMKGISEALNEEKTIPMEVLEKELRI